MNIDFHYGVIYVVARLGGLNRGDAQTVAHACQYIDDSTVHGILEFEGGETFDRFASGYVMVDCKNALSEANRIAWAPFHFLPAGHGESLEEKSICRPDSEIAKEVVRRAIEANDRINALHRLGVALHAYVDTWAHQNFTGTASKHNHVTSLEGDEHDHDTWLEKLKELLSEQDVQAESEILDQISVLGHGAALHFPDTPWAKWKYTNGHGMEIERNNLPDFIAAADMACKTVRGFVSGNVIYDTEPGLNADAKRALEELLTGNQDHDELKRYEVLAKAVASGRVPGIKEEIPKYVAKGEGSWKHAATGITEAGTDGQVRPTWSQTFEDSDYRKFHDAVKEHRFVVTQEILPEHRVRLA